MAKQKFTPEEIETLHQAHRLLQPPRASSVTNPMASMATIGVF